MTAEYLQAEDVEPPRPEDFNGHTPPQLDEDTGEEVPFRFFHADIGEFIKRPKTQVAREYERKMAGLLNAGMRARITTPGGLPDAAALIAYGDQLSAAAGELAQADPRARKGIDFICQPANPYIMFAFAALPLVTQLMRNHEATVSQVGKLRKKGNTPKVPKPTVTIALPRGKSLTVKVPFKPRWPRGFLRAQTQEPTALVSTVFSNETVLRSLQKAGINVPVA